MNSRPHKVCMLSVVFLEYTDAVSEQQSMSELKLRRLTEHNQRLREDLARPRVRVSEASSRFVSCQYPYLASC